ncbi:MAG: arylesterase [Burkholderiales bacterium]|nr:arylesterase [Burkholderiales bacterium]MDE1927518.1 arylesterase [Burkholderiales bacterium]MDE2145446.1 arylesterase [Burkholderiales bacterium]MDE2501710.1 arylesterase [Burkholderiales bacterium]
MRGSDIETRETPRRGWIAHCSLLLALAWAAPALALAAPRHTAPAPARLVLVLGDSLSAEYGLARGSGWVALMQARLAQRRPPVTVVNASISGETTAGGRSRLPALLARHRPEVVVLELGANDALRGLPLAATKANLDAMTAAAQAAGARVVLVGMMLPPNYGRRYGDDFKSLFAEVARARRAALVPFLLAGVADAPDADALFQDDRLHPLARAHPRLLANVWPVLAPLIR